MYSDEEIERMYNEAVKTGDKAYEAYHGDNEDKTHMICQICSLVEMRYIPAIIALIEILHSDEDEIDKSNRMVHMLSHHLVKVGIGLAILQEIR